MGLQKTLLNNKKIKEILKEKYNINLEKIEKIDRGSSNIFKIYSKDKKYILKEFNDNKPLENVEKEIDILEFLYNKNINVPKYIKTLSGKYYTINQNRIIILQEFIEGYTIENNTGDYDKVIECSNILGEVTKALLGYKELSDEGILEKKFSEKSLIESIGKIEKFITEIKEDNKYKEKVIEDLNCKKYILKELIKIYNDEILGKVTIINCHGDYSSQQLIYNDKKETTVIDFERAKKMPVVWEIMRSYLYINKEIEDGEIDIQLLIEYFKEFNKYIKLNKYDLKYAATMYLVQSTGSVFGYEEYNKDYTEKELLKFGFFRTKVCKMMYNELEVINKELKNIYGRG